jgi:hypothetical protein
MCWIVENLEMSWVPRRPLIQQRQVEDLQLIIQGHGEDNSSSGP